MTIAGLLPFTVITGGAVSTTGASVTLTVILSDAVAPSSSVTMKDKVSVPMVLGV